MTTEPSQPTREEAGSPWLLSEAAKSCAGVLYGPDGNFPSEVAVDSRNVQPGGVFIAMKGQRTDGHVFLKQAFEGGARLIVAEKTGWLQSGRNLPSGRSLILTEGSTTEALLRMARHHFNDIAPDEVIAITGSVGKTTTREITATLLRNGHRIHVAQKSHNTDVGCALTVLGMPVNTEILILEMGCSHPGEIAEMVDWFPPTRAIITEVGPSHLEGLTDVQGVLRAKLEILRSKRLLSLSFNRDNGILTEGLLNTTGTDIPMTGVGRSREADLRIMSMSVERGLSSPEKPFFRFLLERGEERAVISYSLFGLHHAQNVALALSVVLAIEKHPLADFHLSMKSPKGRGQLSFLPGGGIVVDDSYNANPLSVGAALKNFLAFMPEKEHWIILGGMKELGQKSLFEHRALFEESSVFRKRIFVGQEWDFISPSLDQGLWLAEDADAAINILRSKILPGDYFLVKGSRSYKLERIVDWLVNPLEC